MTRVACGSSHSIAWSDVNTQIPINHEPVPFPVPEDALGSNSLCKRRTNAPASSNEKVHTKQRPSLSKIVLALRRRNERQRAFGYILSALQIYFAREAVVNALSRKSITPFEVNRDSLDPQSSDARLSPSAKSVDLSTIPQATLSEVILSNATSDVSLEKLSKHLGIKDAELLVDVLKLAVANRTSEEGKQSISLVLKGLAKDIPEVRGDNSDLSK